MNSFKTCELTNNIDGSEDDKIIVFQDGKCCVGRLEEFHRELEQPNNSLTLQQNEEENEHDDNFIKEIITMLLMVIIITCTDYQ